MRGHTRRIRYAMLLLACTFPAFSHADFFPHRIYKIRSMENLNRSWKFIKADPAGASSAGFDDASWETINLPHSAGYDPPTIDGEQNSVPQSSGWDGVHWYRRRFEIPSSEHNRKVFLKIDGAMQIAEVYINGTLAGTHDVCGYTGFHFDITDLVNRTGENTCAIKLDCRYRGNIPPGRAGTYTTYGNNIEYPDFFLYSGLYRDVWLVCTDNVYIPIHGQKIETPDVSLSEATVRVKTTVHNDNDAPRDVTVSFCLVDRNDAVVASAEMTNRIEPDAAFVFDTTLAPIENPELWSPETPYVYRIFTKVSTQGTCVDDYVERFGIRSITWRNDGGFYLNDERFLLRGVCMHQEFAWVQNAVPRSRFFEEVRLAKEMGSNAIRCAHYPRAEAFYNACDELGMICLPELPSWGCCGKEPYPDDFWDRMNGAAREMVDEGYNHPSIILWGMFNEPGSIFEARFGTLDSTLRQLDNTRPTAIYGASTQVPYLTADVYGMNYELYPHANVRNQVKGSFVAEYHEGWLKWCFRGDTATVNDATLSGALSENRFAEDRWSGTNNWTTIHAAWNGATRPVPGGGFMWCFVDYWSPVQDYPMGVLDNYRIPKKAFYTFRSNWTGVADDNFVEGTVPVSVRLEADLESIIADSTDITRIVGSLRDTEGRCSFSSQDITLQLHGPADCFDPLTKSTVAGKTGWVLKSRNSPGTVTIIGTADNLLSDTVTVECVPPDATPLPFIWPTSNITLPSRDVRKDGISRIYQQHGTIVIVLAGPDTKRPAVSVMTIRGQIVPPTTGINGSNSIITLQNIATGIYFLKIGGTIAKKLIVTNGCP